MQKNYCQLFIILGLLNLIIGMGDEMGWFLVSGLALMWTGFLGLRRLTKAEQAASATDEKEER